MNNYQFFCVLATVWIASYKPDVLNWVIGAFFAVLAIMFFYVETRK